MNRIFNLSKPPRLNTRSPGTMTSSITIKQQQQNTRIVSKIHTTAEEPPKTHRPPPLSKRQAQNFSISGIASRCSQQRFASFMDVRGHYAFSARQSPCPRSHLQPSPPPPLPQNRLHEKERQLFVGSRRVGDSCSLFFKAAELITTVLGKTIICGNRDRPGNT